MDIYDGYLYTTAQFETIMWSGVNLTATIGIAVNLAFLYLLIRNKRVRDLSVHGLLMLSATNDVMLNLFSLSGFPTTIRYWMGWYASFRQCTFELSREFYLVTQMKMLKLNKNHLL